MGDVAGHQLVQLVGGEGGDDHAELALLVRERGEERKEHLLEEQGRWRKAELGADDGNLLTEHLLEEHERWRQAELGADDGRKELVQLLHQPILLQKLSSYADGAWQAVHGGVLGAVWVCGHGARSGCSDGSRSHRQEYFAAN